MADCDLCGVSRPTLCPVKVNDLKVKAAYPGGTWRGVNEECLESCHEANASRIPAEAKRCDLCGIKNVPFFQVRIRVPTFQEPYHREGDKALCENCLLACEDAIKSKKEEAHH